MGTDQVTVSAELHEAPPDEWRTYDEFAAGIDTYRLPQADLSGETIEVALTDGPTLRLEFLDGTRVRWSAGAPLDADEAIDPYDAVQVRPDVRFVHLPCTSRDREALTVVLSSRTGRAIGIRSRIAEERDEDVPQVAQTFWTGSVVGVPVSGDEPGPSRDLIGRRNVYRYSPQHLYEHVYLSSERYCWQCLQGVQRGHGDVDLSTVWRLEDGLYLFCFREFKIAVASVWLHDLGYALRTTGIFLGLNGAGASEHSRAGGHIYPLSSTAYPDVQPV